MAYLKIFTQDYEDISKNDFSSATLCSRSFAFLRKRKHWGDPNMNLPTYKHWTFSFFI